MRTGAAPPPLVVPDAVLRSYVGTYATEGPVLVVAMGADGRLTMRPPVGPALPMRAVSPTEFRVDEARTCVVFHPENGRVDGMTLHRGARVLNGHRTGG